MSGFRRDAQGAALFSGTPLTDLCRQASVGTPAYFYDLDGLAEGARALEAAFGNAPHLTAYAVKANTAATVLRTLARAGTGADVVSGAELEVALGAGIPPSKIVMSGVGKQDFELDLAIARGIRAVQVESIEELDRLAARARALGKSAPVGVRINPGVAIDSHAHVATGHDDAKFGVPKTELARAWRKLRETPELDLVGVSAHVGSMLRDPAPYVRAARAVAEAAQTARAEGLALSYVNFGGGFGIDYGAGKNSEPADFARAALALLGELGMGELELMIEPGRALVGPYGLIVARVIQPKVSGERRWAVIDAGMNDLLRPALYGAKHRIEPVSRAPSAPEWRVVGPVCESSDDFGAHPLGDPLPELVVIRDAGAYGFVMASEYNGRGLPAEVFVSGGKVAHVSPSPGRQAWIQRRLGA